MSARKPLEEECTGSILCPVHGHTKARFTKGGVIWSHVPLTTGQRKTLWERRQAERGAKP